MVSRNKKYVLFFLLLVITALVCVCGVLFSARNFSSYCYNYADEEVARKVEFALKNHCENKNIFLINEKELKTKIQSELPSVEVVSIERIFPCTVKAHYKVKKTYAYVVDGGVYKYVSKDGKILHTDGGELLNSQPFIKIVTDEDILGGEYAFSKSGITVTMLNEMLTMFEKMGIYNGEVLISEIDFTFLATHALIVYWREGARIEIEYPSQNFHNKIRLFASALIGCDPKKRTVGVWRVYANKISYAEN